MSDLDDFDLSKPSPEEEEEAALPPPGDDTGRRAPLWVGGGLLAALILAAAGYFGLRGRAQVPAAPAPTPGASLAPAPAAPPSASPTPMTLPPLEESDALVRELAKGLSSQPLFAAWLGAEDLLNRLAAATAAVVEGSPLHQPLDFLAPQGTFSVQQRAGRTVIAPASYARYDAIAAAVASVDAPAAASALRRLEPLLDAACAQLGLQSSFASLLERAVQLLLATPLPSGEVEVKRVVRARVVYVYARPELEALRPAQKHLLRMGPENARRVTAKLREVLLAAGKTPPPGGR